MNQRSQIRSETVARTHQIVFSVSLLALCWLGMMAVHELGHVLGAFFTGGSVQAVVLHPLAISRTDVSPNPAPLIVVWSGPTMGVLLPLIIWNCIPKPFTTLRNIVGFFAGFCCVVNGAYIAIGSIDQIGDCKVMLQHGSPTALLILFGLLTIPTGLWIWHQLGSLRSFFDQPSLVPARTVYFLVAILILIVAVELTFNFPM